MMILQHRIFSRGCCISQPTSGLMLSSSSYSSASPLLCTARRFYKQDEFDQARDASINPDNLLTMCGFQSSDSPSKMQLSVAFRRELTKLRDLQKSTLEQAKIDAESGMEAYLIQPENIETQKLVNQLLCSADARRLKGVNHNIPDHVRSRHQENAGGSVDSDSTRIIRQLVDQRIAKLIEAYRSLNRSRYWYLYDSATDNSNSVLLGYKRSDSTFANFDDRRQEFFFSSSDAKPLADFATAYKKTVQLEDTDVEDAVVDGKHVSKPGTHVQFVLTIEFSEAFTGCNKMISFRRRDPCRVCKGTGLRRQKTQRCTQCGGRGQLQLPSGSYIVPKDCSLCLGSGSVLPPDCGACSGTGLGAMVEHRASVHVSPGASDGDSICLRGVGHAGTRGGKAGHCFVNVVVKQHKFFNRDGDDLHVIVPVQLSVVLGGGSISVPALEDDGSSTFVNVAVGNQQEEEQDPTGMIDGEYSGQQQQQAFRNLGEDDAANNESNEGDQKTETSKSKAEQQQPSKVQPMVSDRVVLVPHFGMWRKHLLMDRNEQHRAAEVVNRSNIASSSSSSSASTISRGNLYVHCVGVTPHVDTLTKAQRAVLLEHFFVSDNGEEIGSKLVQRERVADFGEDVELDEYERFEKVTVISESEFSVAKAMCRHWLP